jgi:hypothetical protein
MYTSGKTLIEPTNGVLLKEKVYLASSFTTDSIASGKSEFSSRNNLIYENK